MYISTILPRFLYCYGRLTKFKWLQICLCSRRTRDRTKHLRDNDKIGIFMFAHFRSILWISGVRKESSLSHMCGSEMTLKQRDHWRLMRILTWDRRTTHPQTVANFNTGTSENVSVRTVHHTYGLSIRQPTHVLLLMTQSCTPCRKPATLLLNFWWLQTHYLVRRMSFPKISFRWTVRLLREPHESIVSICH